MLTVKKKNNQVAGLIARESSIGLSLNGFKRVRADSQAPGTQGSPPRSRLRKTKAICDSDEEVGTGVEGKMEVIKIGRGQVLLNGGYGWGTHLRYWNTEQGTVVTIVSENPVSKGAMKLVYKVIISLGYYLSSSQTSNLLQIELGGRLMAAKVIRDDFVSLEEGSGSVSFQKMALIESDNFASLLLRGFGGDFLRFVEHVGATDSISSRSHPRAVCTD